MLDQRLPTWVPGVWAGLVESDSANCAVAMWSEILHRAEPAPLSPPSTTVGTAMCLARSFVVEGASGDRDGKCLRGALHGASQLPAR